MGFGIDLTDLRDEEIRQVLARASAIVEAYCAVPQLPQRHDMRGGTITSEEHSWAVGMDLVTGQRRMYPWHQPVRSVSSFRIYVTNSQYVEIAPSELFINNSEGYVEVVALAVTSIGVFGSGLLPNVGLARPVGRISYTYGFVYEVDGEILEETDANTFRSVNAFWDLLSPYKIYVNDVELAADKFSIDADEGEVTITADLVIDDVITADYYYSLSPEIVHATGIIATDLLAERELVAKGMGQLAAMQIGEMTLRRTPGHAGGAVMVQTVPEDAKTLLDPFRYVTAR